MCGLLKQYGPLLGRILLSAIFIIAGISKITGFSNTAAYMASKGLPMAEVLLVLTIIIELGGGVMILVGWKARWAATAIFFIFNSSVDYLSSVLGVFRSGRYASVP